MQIPRLLLPAALLALLVPGALAEVCRTSSGCEFWDNSYHEYVLYQVDTAQVDVLILPPASPFPLRDIELAKLAAESWEDGVDAYGQTWLKSNFNVSAYAVGLDVVPPEALADPEVVIVISEHDPVLLFGIGLQVPLAVCAQQGGVAGAEEPHVHDGVFVQQVQCKTGGRTCVALNTSFLLGGSVRMYDLIAHEFGHCLGTGHVGDALDFDAKTVPAYDVMSYMYRSSHVNCVSNLNVRVMEGVFGRILGQPASTHLYPGSYYAMSTSTYRQHACANPDVGILG